MNEWQQIFHDLLESERYFTLSVDLPKKLPRLYGNKTNDDLKESRSSSYRFTSFCSVPTPCVSLLACHLFVILINDASPNADPHWRLRWQGKEMRRLTRTNWADEVLWQVKNSRFALNRNESMEEGRKGNQTISNGWLEMIYHFIWMGFPLDSLRLSFDKDQRGDYPFAWSFSFGAAAATGSGIIILSVFQEYEFLGSFQ